LLDRLKVATQDDPQWIRLHEIYAPWIARWLARMPGLRDDAADLTQEVLLVLVKEVPYFDRRRDGAFRRWLSTVLLNRVRAYWKERQRRPQTYHNGDTYDIMLDQLADPTSMLSRQWDDEHDRFVLDRLMNTVHGDFNQITWEAFRRCALAGEPASSVAADLGISAGAVLSCKSRVIKRLRQEASGLVD
jgi:RNA polymerase sigma-70 factor (ECF subfamily)